MFFYVFSFICKYANATIYLNLDNLIDPPFEFIFKEVFDYALAEKNILVWKIRSLNCPCERIGNYKKISSKKLNFSKTKKLEAFLICFTSNLFY